MREAPVVVLLLALALLVVVRRSPLPALDLWPEQLLHVHGQVALAAARLRLFLA